MTVAFVLLSILTLAGALAAVSLRNLVHCALALAIAFAGVAGLYLQLGAEFVGFAQFLVYIGAVAILVVFAILLTRSSEPGTQPLLSSGWAWSLAVAATVFGTITTLVLRTPVGDTASSAPPLAPVKEIGQQLMTRHVLALEAIGLLLTAALIGAVILAMTENSGNGGEDQ